MKKILTLILLIPLTFFGQSNEVSGTITNEAEESIPFANVLIKDTSNGVTSDFDGNYKIRVSKGETLVFSFIGYHTQEITIADTNVIDITLISSKETLDEVVVVGYGTTKRKDLTGAISSVSSEEILEQPALSAMEAIQGRSAGVQIINDGEPGGSPVVRIRGTGTVQSGRDPIYVVDGIITDNLDNINSADIETIDVLKDASSLAIYGSRGANGVIIVTTKKAAVGKLKIQFSSYTGVTDVLKKVDMANAAQWQQYYFEVFGSDEDAFNDEFGGGPYGDYPLDSPNDTDWFDEITTMGSVINHNFSLSGGSEKVRSFVSANFYQEEGILKDNDYNRFTLRAKTDYEITDKLTFGHNISIALTNRDKKPTGAFQSAYRQLAIIPVRDPITNQYGTSGEYATVGNPVEAIETTNSAIKQFTISGSAYAQYNINNYISVRSNFGIQSSYLKSTKFDGERDLFDPNYGQGGAGDAKLTERRSDNTKWTFDLYATLKKTLGTNHNFNLVVGTTTDYRTGSYILGQINHVPEQEQYWSINNGESILRLEGLNSTDIIVRSYLSRLNYDFDHKYLLTLSGRRDGSSQFSDGNKWGNFYAIGAGWVVSEENFMSDVNFIDFLKFRGSWGQLGNQNVPLQILTFTNGLNYTQGPNQDIVYGSTITSILDPNLTWETTEEYDIGVEFELFKSRLSGAVDYYNKLNKDAALATKLPATFGSEESVISNLAQIRNEGYEVGLNWSDKVSKSFRYSIGANISFNENNLESLTSDTDVTQTGGLIPNGGILTKRLEVGQPLGSWYLHTVKGVDPITGLLQYEKADGTITTDVNTLEDEDKRYHGSSQPTKSFGVNLKLNYKDFELVVLGYGVTGGNIYNAKKQQRYNGENIELDVYNNRWTPTNTITSEPKPFTSIQPASTYYLEKSDFFRINNITLSYKLPKVFDNVNLIRVYATAKNPFIFTNYTGYNPELPGVNDENTGRLGKGDPMGTQGMEFQAYPSKKTFIVGLNVNF